jgi:predicted MFS family arabinose efflux permease
VGISQCPWPRPRRYLTDTCNVLIVGAFVASAGGWRWSFYINLLIGAVTAPVMIFYLPSRNPYPNLTVLNRLKNIDWPGIILVTASLALFTLALSFGGNQYPWNSGVVIGFFVASGVLCILFGLSQHTRTPRQTLTRRIFPMHYFLKKDMVLLSIATGAGTCAMFAAIYYIPLFFQFTRGDTAIKAAVRLLPLIVLAVFTTVAGGAALSMTGYYTPWYIGGSILVIIGYSLLYTITPTTSQAKIYGYLVIIGTGTGSYVNFGFSVAQAISLKSETEAAISFIMQGQLLGIVIGLAIAGSVFITHAIAGLTELFPGVPESVVKAAIAGTNAGFLSQLSEEMQAQALDVIVKSMDRVYILGITAGVVSLLCGLFLSQRKLDMKGAAAGI